ncbi:MAG: hypothetical protein Q8P54_00650 [bacterium]|nr:hypothetical protein [bacterium]
MGHKPWDKRKKKRHAWLQTIERRVDEFASDPSELVIGDLPGKLSNPNMDLMVADADYSILVNRRPLPEDATRKHPQFIEEWEAYMAERSIPVIANVYSVDLGQKAPLGSIAFRMRDRQQHGLDPESPAVKQVLTILASLNAAKSVNLAGHPSI